MLVKIRKSVKGRSVLLLIKIDIVNAYLLMMFVVIFVVSFFTFSLLNVRIPVIRGVLLPGAMNQATPQNNRQQATRITDYKSRNKEQGPTELSK